MQSVKKTTVPGAVLLLQTLVTVDEYRLYDNKDLLTAVTFDLLLSAREHDWSTDFFRLNSCLVTQHLELFVSLGGKKITVIKLF